MLLVYFFVNEKLKQGESKVFVVRAALGIEVQILGLHFLLAHHRVDQLALNHLSVDPVLVVDFDLHGLSADPMKVVGDSQNSLPVLQVVFELALVVLQPIVVLRRP